MLRTPFIETLSDLFIRSAQWRGRDELFVDDTDRITGTEALDSALRISQGFADHGAGPGDVIAYLCRSSARHAVAWFAAPLSGRIACSLHVRETPERLGQALDWLDAKILVHDDDLEAQAVAAIIASGRTIRRISLGARGGADADYGTLVATGAIRRRVEPANPPTSPRSCSPRHHRPAQGHHAYAEDCWKPPGRSGGDGPDHAG
jgi:acyl-CoA synthetase (AMP-forming)/AMP-acid ligase II